MMLLTTINSNLLISFEFTNFHIFNLNCVRYSGMGVISNLGSQFLYINGVLIIILLLYPFSMIAKNCKKYAINPNDLLD